MYRAGWRQHRYPLPTGHSDVRRAWTGASTLNRVVDLVLAAHDGGFETTSTDIGAIEPGETVEAFLTRRIVGFGADRAAQVVRDAAEFAGADLAAPAAEMSEDDRRGMATAAIAFAALGPEFLQR